MHLFAEKGTFMRVNIKVKTHHATMWKTLIQANTFGEVEGGGELKHFLIIIADFGKEI